MPITLDDAVERAKIMSGQDGLISQESYNLLLNALAEEDRYSFTMALVDHGIIAKNASSQDNSVMRFLIGEPKTDVIISEILTSEEYLRDKFARIALRNLRGQFDVDESGQVTYGGEETSPFQETPEIDQTRVNDLRERLESAGISISEDGQVSFYKSSVPGVYSDKLPQSMTLENAVSYYNQVSRISQKESDKSDKILNNLAKLSGQENEIALILEDLKGLKFSQQSKNDYIVNISKSLQSLVSTISESSNAKLVEYIDDLKNQFEQYKFDQEAKRDQYTQMSETLSELLSAKTDDPGLYTAVVKGLGGI